MNRTRRTGRDLVVWAVLTGGIVALVLGQGIIGAVLCVFAVWQFYLINAGKGGLFVDQRDADREGKPNLGSK